MPNLLNRRCRCAYCNKEIHTANAAYMFCWVDSMKDTNTQREKHPGLFELLEKDSERSSRRKKQYNTVQNSLGGDIDGNLDGIYFFTAAEWRAIRQRIPEIETEEDTAEDTDNIFSADFSEFTGESTNTGETDNPGSVPESLYSTVGIGYAAQDSNNMECDVRYGLVTLAFVRRVCEHCYHLIPDALFHIPLYRIQLVAPPACGKTSALYAIFDHIEKFNTNLGSGPLGTMHIDTIQDPQVDRDFRSFMRKAHDFEKAQDKAAEDPAELRHEASPVTYLPPLFLLVEYRRPDWEETRSLVLAVYDCGGELYNAEREDDAVYLNANRVKEMDALWVMIDASHTAGNTAIDDLRLSSEALEQIRTLGRNRVYSNDEQEQIEVLAASRDVPVADQLDYLRICSERPLSGSTDSAEDHRLLHRMSLQAKGRDVLRTLITRMGGAHTLRETVRNLDLALIITKADYLQRSSQILQKELFFRMSSGYFDPDECESYLMRSALMEEWIREWKLMNFDPMNFKTSSYHFIASRVEDNPLAFDPIRVEEPLVYAVQNAFIRLDEEETDD